MYETPYSILVSVIRTGKPGSFDIITPPDLCLFQAWSWFAVRVGSCWWFTSRPWLRCRLSRSPRAPWHRDPQPPPALHLSRSLLCRYQDCWTHDHRNCDSLILGSDAHIWCTRSVLADWVWARCGWCTLITVTFVLFTNNRTILLKWPQVLEECFYKHIFSYS